MAIKFSAIKQEAIILMASKGLIDLMVDFKTMPVLGDNSVSEIVFESIIHHLIYRRTLIYR